MPGELNAELDQFIRSLQTFVRWDDKHDQYVMVDPEWCATISFTPEGLRVWWDDWTPEWEVDIFRLVTFARSKGLGFFDEPGKERSWDDIRTWLEPRLP